jgi:hypothetical protein
MKRLHKTLIIVAVLLFAASAISTTAFALAYDTEQHVVYYQNGEQVGGAVYSSCGGWNWSWGQQSGDLKLEKAIRCDDGSPVYCRWYSWTGSDWELIHEGSCTPGDGPPRPDRPLR